MTGRPSKIDAVVGTRKPGGEPITLAERIIDGLGVGMYFETAIANSGAPKSTVYGWLSVAGKARIRTAGNDDDRSLTPFEKQCIEFSDAVERTSAQWHAAKLTELEHAERGGVERIIVTEKLDTTRTVDGKHPVVERTTRTEVMPPDTGLIRWRLKHRFPDEYAERVEVTGADGGPLALSVADRANALADSLEEQQRLNDAEVVSINGKRRRRKPQPPAQV